MTLGAVDLATGGTMIRISTNSFSWNTTYNVGLPDLSGPDICREAARCGAAGIEMDPSRVTAEDLRSAGIVLSGASTGGTLFDNWSPDDEDATVAAAAARALGGDYVFFTVAPKGGWGSGAEVSPADLRLAGERFNALATRVRAEGIAIGLHNHAASPAGFAAELALVRDWLDPALAGLYFDMGWAYCSDADPLALITEFAPRLMALHFRNHAADGIPTQTLAEGVLDIPAIASALRAADYEGWVALELWHREDVHVTRTMAACQAESVAWLRSLLG